MPLPSMPPEEKEHGSRPFQLACEQCGACCRWPGEVRVSAPEISALASHLKMSEQDFVESLTRLRKDRRGLALVEKANHSCIFLENNQCRVHEAKPIQCRDFPNRWMDHLWGRISPDQLQRLYPMLLGCPAVQDFLQTQPPGDQGLPSMGRTTS